MPPRLRWSNQGSQQALHDHEAFSDNVDVAKFGTLRVKGLFHLQRRKRAASGELEPYPARTFAKRLLDQVVLVVGIVGPVSALPQLLEIYSLHAATGVSVLSWSLSALFDIPWIVYGIVHRERPIMVTYSLWFAMNLAVSIGAIIYGSRPY